MNDNLYTDSSQNIGSAIAPRKQSDVVNDAKERALAVKLTLDPVMTVTRRVMEKHRQSNENIKSYFATFSAMPSGEDLWAEYRGREVFLSKLEAFEKDLVTELTEELKNV